MKQFVPDVSESDVVRELISQVKVREKPRVVLACLKNSAGDFKKLTYNLSEAPGYYREHIGEAEYPNYIKKIFHIDKLSEAEQSAIFEKDKNQYLSWLNREKEHKSN